MKLQVDVRSSWSIVGTILKWLVVPLLIPLTIALFERVDVMPFAVTGIALLICGLALERLKEDPTLQIREGFLVVFLSWLLCALFGALPFLLAGKGALGSPVNAFFESMSGFTTTGASVLDQISPDTYSHSLLMWRQMTQWLGGMGVIVLSIAILPRLAVGGSSLIDLKTPGPEDDQLARHIIEIARRLWWIYVGLTLLLIGVLYTLHVSGLAPNMVLFDSVAHGFSTLSTGGFSPATRSIAAYSPYVQWTLIPFMLIAGTSFVLLWKSVTGHPIDPINKTEFRTYIRIIMIFFLVLFLVLWMFNPVEQILDTVRHALFQVVTIISTTGYVSTDFNQWGWMVKTLLFIAMFVGGCAGSTGGGIKIIRWIVWVKELLRELYLSIHPRVVRPLRVDKQTISDRTIRNIAVFILVYVLLFVFGTSLVYIDQLRVGVTLEPLEVMSTTAACLGNIGPALGLAGPMNSYNAYSDFSKLILTMLMWFGRLEIIAVFVLFLPAYWKSY